MKQKELMLLQLLAKAESYPKWWGGSGYFEGEGNWVKRLIKDLELLPEVPKKKKEEKKSG